MATERERQELENNRGALWEMYRIVNPPVGVHLALDVGQRLWLENGRLNMGTKTDKVVVAMWATFCLEAVRPVHVHATSVQHLDGYLNAHQLELREAWLDGEPRNHRS